MGYGKMILAGIYTQKHLDFRSNHAGMTLHFYKNRQKNMHR